MPEISIENTMMDAKALRQQAQEAKRKNRRDSWHRFAKNKVALTGLIVIILLVILAVIAPYVAPYKYDKIDPIHAYQPPSKEHLFGTDGLGRDLFSRVLYGTRYSLAIAFTAQLFGILGGIFFGSLAGFFGGELLGENVLIAQLADIIYSTEGVRNYRISLPSSDVTVSETELPVAGTIQISPMGE